MTQEMHSSANRVFAIAQACARTFRRDVGAITILFFLPIAVMAFFQPVAKLVIQQQGYPHSTGAEQVVPGMSLMFAFFMIGVIGFSFRRDRECGMWPRLITSPLRVGELLMGKLAVPLGVLLVQTALLFAIGMLAFGLRVRGSYFALAVLACSLSICLCCLGLLAAAFCRTDAQVAVASNAAGVGLGSLGGAFVPVQLLPAWARAVSPATPTYWAMKSYREVILDGRGIASIAGAVWVLLAFAAAAAAIATWRFRGQVSG